jgi:peptide chain release factor 3
MTTAQTASTGPEAPRTIAGQAARRRTFAIISHPDAGKTTLTEKLLLYGGALREAGQVHARGGRRAAASDWMELEQTRGISVTSTVLRFEHDGTVLNLLDTPGHRDFSEDTMRVLAAADCAVILLDAARGVQEQTRMLFEVARARRMPVITFVNKYDRPGMDPLGMLDHIETELGLRPAPMMWPVGAGGEFRGLIDRREDRFLRLDRTARGAREVTETEVDIAALGADDGPEWQVAAEELELVEAAGETFDPEEFLAGRCTPVFFGSAMWNFGVRQLLRAVVDLAPGPRPRRQGAGVRPLDAPFAGQVFKVQSNTDPRHRDRLAYIRICSGRFERGMKVLNVRTGRPVTLSYAHDVFGRDRDQLLDAYPGDVIGISGAQDLQVGDTLAADAGAAPFDPIPTLVPERFVTARPEETSKRKQFRRGLEQVDEEGVVHVLRRTTIDDPVPILGAVGDLQLDVCKHRMATEFGCPIRLEQTQWNTARRIDAADADVVRAFGRSEVLLRADGATLAVFPGVYDLGRFERDHPGVRLTRVLGDVPEAMTS